MPIKGRSLGYYINCFDSADRQRITSQKVQIMQKLNSTMEYYYKKNVEFFGESAKPRNEIYTPYNLS